MNPMDGERDDSVPRAVARIPAAGGQAAAVGGVALAVSFLLGAAVWLARPEAARVEVPGAPPAEANRSAAVASAREEGAGASAGEAALRETLANGAAAPATRSPAGTEAHDELDLAPLPDAAPRPGSQRAWAESWSSRALAQPERFAAAARECFAEQATSLPERLALLDVARERDAALALELERAALGAARLHPRDAVCARDAIALRDAVVSTLIGDLEARDVERAAGVANVLLDVLVRVEADGGDAAVRRRAVHALLRSAPAAARSALIEELSGDRDLLVAAEVRAARSSAPEGRR